MTMRAAVFNSYGAPDVLYVTDVPRPSPARGEVLVRVAASSVNGGEIMGRQGRLKAVTGRKFPQRMGIDFVGKIVEIGDGVVDLPVGEHVWGALNERGGLGAAAEYVTVSADQLAPAPAGLTAAEAVSLLSGGSTALAALRDAARLRPGERLLVRGAAGGVGSVAVQVGKMLGAHVTGLVNTASAGFVRDLGADEIIDYRTPARELDTFDVIFDTRGTDLSSFRSRLARGGRMVTIAFDIDHIVRSIGSILWSSLHGVSRVRLFFGHPDRALLADVARAVADGSLRPVVDTIYPLERIDAAHAHLEAGGVRGKIVINVAAEATEQDPFNGV